MALYTEAQAAHLAKGIVRPVFLFRMVTTDKSVDPVTTSVLRLWGGVGSLSLSADAVETTSDAIYYGAGELANVPALEQLINGVADRVDFTLSGVGDNRLPQIADEEAATVRGARVNIGVMFLDQDWSELLPQRWLWEGRADTLDPESQATDAGRVRGLRLSVGSLFTGRRRPNSSFYTDKSQKTRSAGDLFCSRVGLYKQEQGKPWPRV